MLAEKQRVRLGASPVEVSPLGAGAWAWGDRLIWGYGESHDDDDLADAYGSIRASGVNFLDTAEVYGNGRSEELVGQFTAGDEDVVVATKFFPYPWRLFQTQLTRALRGSLERLKTRAVDLYQIHWPWPPRAPEAWVEALAEAVESRWTRAVGVSNFSAAQVRSAHRRLAERGIPLASNQIRYSLLDRQPETDGVLDACRELGVTVIAYSPLAMGLLTGKYSQERRPKGMNRYRTNGHNLERAERLLPLMKEIGEGHGGRTPAQVALNWLMCKEAVPIPGAKNARQAKDNAGALGWRLTEAEVAALDQASAAAV